MMPLHAAARLQLHAGFTLYDAAERLPYYADLGAGHLCLSPISATVPGSTWGYDTIDSGVIDPELGGEDGFRHLAEQAYAWGIGLVLEIVPSHMAAHSCNAWWWDLLLHGRRSRYHDWFDIDWCDSACGGKVWLPVLDRPYAQALQEGMLTVTVADGGVARLWYGEHCFPLRLNDGDTPEGNTGCQDWTTGLAVAAENSDDLHRLLERQCYRLAGRQADDLHNYRRFPGDGAWVALRVEQPEVFAAMHALPLRLTVEGILDGLQVAHIDHLADPGAYLRQLRGCLNQIEHTHGRRILLHAGRTSAPDESVFANGSYDGGMGYDFMDHAGAVLHDPVGEAPLAELWRSASGRSGDFLEEEAKARTELLCAVPNGRSVDMARHRYGVLLSRNDAGGRPDRFALSVERFHGACLRRREQYPQALLATATWDCRYGEDVRARLAVLSERAEWWRRKVAELSERAVGCCPWLYGGSPAPGDVLMLWQLLVAAWPLWLNCEDKTGLRMFAERAAAWQIAALRRAGLRTCQADPNYDYEQCAHALIAAILIEPEGAEVRRILARAAASIGPAGALNGLAQVVLRSTVPGVPVFYEGTEDWDLSLRDADGCQPVDYRRYQAWLREDVTWTQLLTQWRDGRVKAHLTAQLLQLRRTEASLFTKGDHQPLAGIGDFAGHLLAFRRQYEGRAVTVIVPRLCSVLLNQCKSHLPRVLSWGNTAILAPDSHYWHVLEGRDHASCGGRLYLSEVFRDCPVAVLSSFS
ncbi:MAG: hypothetical protein LBV45_10685 [Xanthomonadaceae bacterium]|jgi:maltooligosyltrehalose synthase|nr:hypothetical protein [Xanthomonadaceae bacterium]